MSVPTVETAVYSLHTRILLGPKFKRVGEVGYWDWSALDAGAAYTPPVETTLHSQLAPAAATADLHAAAGIPDAGGLWVGPADGDTTSSWEWLPYTSATVDSGIVTLYGLQREAVTDEQSGLHPVGSRVTFWHVLDCDDGRVTLTEQLDGNYSAKGLTLSISGVGFPRQLMRNHHLVLLQGQWADPDGVFGDWTNLAVGWIVDPRAQDDRERAARWDTAVGGTSDLLAVLGALPLRAGPLNLAKLGNASASRPLAKWYKEAHAGEFPAYSDADLSPGAAIDEDMDTLYISEVYIGSDNCIEDSTPDHKDYLYPDLDGAMLGLDQVHITRYTGQGRGYRWFQVHCKPGKDVMPRIYNADNICVDPVDTAQQPAPDSTASPRVIFCENAQRFNEENPYTSIDPNGTEPSTEIIEINNDQWETSDGNVLGVDAWWDSFDPDGGSVFCSTGGSVQWGSAGSMIALLPGQTIRKLWGTNAWEAGYVSMPGYAMHQWMTRQHFFLCELMGLGLTLAADITAASPGVGEGLALVAGDTPCTNGLLTSGSVLVDSEWIAYSSRTAGSLVVSGRAQAGTSGSTHVAGTPVYAHENGLAVDGWPIQDIVWKRKAGTPTLKNFWLFAAQPTIQPRILGDGFWMNDYDQLGDEVLNNTAHEYTHTLSGPNYRYRWVNLIGEQMATDPYRFMLNEFEVHPKPAAFNEHQYLESGTVFQIAREILLGVGIPDGAILDGGGTPTVTGFTTTDDNAWSVLADLMDMTGCFINCGRDGKLTISLHPFWAAETPTVVYAWTRNTLQNFALDHARGHRTGQVELEWVALDNATKGTVRYPAARDPFGQVQRLGPYRYSDQDAAELAVEKLYWQQRRPYGGTIQPAGAPWALEPGVVHSAEWDFAAENVPYKRTVILDRVDHRVERGGFETVCHVVQASREDEL